MRALERRVAHLEQAHDHEQDDALPGPGLAALLAWAKKHPPQPWEDDGGPVTGMQLLLREARQRAREHQSLTGRPDDDEEETC